MGFLPRLPPRSAVSTTGAKLGSILVGAGLSNRGLRLQILQAQTRGARGPIQGGFKILATGDNIHSHSLEPMLGEVTDAGKVLQVIRQRHAQCVNIVNANILVVEEP
jgi:hypothetical protein